MHITSKTKINIIIGDPVEHSLSPQMHNTAYKALGTDATFVFVATTVKPEHLENAIKGIIALNICGVTVTIPHKENVIRYLDQIDQAAQEIGAVNTIINENGKLKGYNTDYLGILKPLEMLTDLKNKKIAILGAGGAARAAAYTMRKQNLDVTIFNRTLRHAEKLAKKFDCGFSSLDNREDIKKADIIINTTSVGLRSNDSPIPEDVINKDQIIFDVIYVPYETKLLQFAKAKGAKIIHGTEMLLYQGLAQFELFTGQKAPIETMRNAIMENV